MRRKREERIQWQTMKTAHFGVLSYGEGQRVAVLFAYHDGKIYINGFPEGGLMVDPAALHEVCFTARGREKVKHGGDGSHVHGGGSHVHGGGGEVCVRATARLLESAGEKKEALTMLAEKYLPQMTGGAVSKEAVEKTAVIELTPLPGIPSPC